MNYWFENYIICLLLSAVLAGFIIPKILLIAFRKKLFDSVDSRKIHHGTVPRLGGIAFLPSIVFSLCLVLGVDISADIFSVTPLFQDSVVRFFFLICALMLMYLTGIADDLIGVRYRGKFIFQIVAGTLIALSGLWVHDLWGFLGIHELSWWVGWLVTIFLCIYIINAINLIDGIDGLASGLSAIALAFYSIIFFMAGQYVYALLSGASLGTLIPFFYYNVFGKSENRTKIFMGDTGSLTIGTILAFVTLAVFNLKGNGRIAEFPDYNLFVLALTPLLLPLLDVVRVFLHRIRRHSNPFLPDKCHIHHKLLALGFKNSTALICILITDTLFIATNLILSPYLSPTIIILLDILIWSLANMLLTHLIRNREKATGIKLYV